MLLLEEQESGAAKGPDVCVTIFSDELRDKTLQVASDLRKAGLSVDVYPGAGKLKNQFKYADAKKARFALILGPEEAAAGQAKIKTLATGDEASVPLSSLAVWLPERCR
jgi:histidyl-tRNA synthetase